MRKWLVAAGVGLFGLAIVFPTVFGLVPLATTTPGQTSFTCVSYVTALNYIEVQAPGGMGPDPTCPGLYSGYYTPGGNSQPSCPPICTTASTTVVSSTTFIGPTTTIIQSVSGGSTVSLTQSLSTTTTTTIVQSSTSTASYCPNSLCCPSGQVNLGGYCGTRTTSPTIASTTTSTVTKTITGCPNGLVQVDSTCCVPPPSGAPQQPCNSMTTTVTVTSTYSGPISQATGLPINAGMILGILVAGIGVVKRPAKRSG